MGCAEGCVSTYICGAQTNPLLVLCNYYKVLYTTLNYTQYTIIHFLFCFVCFFFVFFLFFVFSDYNLLIINWNIFFYRSLRPHHCEPFGLFLCPNHYYAIYINSNDFAHSIPEEKSKPASKPRTSLFPSGFSV